MKKTYIKPVTKNGLAEIGFICQVPNLKAGSPAQQGQAGDQDFPWQGDGPSDDQGEVPERPNEYGIEPMTLW